MILTVVDAKGATAQATASVTVIAPGFSIAATLPSVSTTAGQSAIDHVTFTPNPGIGADMTLACSGLRAGAHCTFVPATVAAGSAQTDVVVTVATAASSAVAARPRVVYGAWLTLAGMGVFGLIFAVPAKRRQASALMLLIVLFGAIGLMPACGGVSTPAPKSHTYTVTVTGISGNVTNTTNFSLTVNWDHRQLRAQGGDHLTRRSSLLLGRIRISILQMAMADSAPARAAGPLPSEGCEIDPGMRR